MVDQTKEIIIATFFYMGMICFWLALGYKAYLAYCRNNFGKKSSECHLEKAQAIFYGTKDASETSESHQQGKTSTIACLLNEQYSV